jgi:N4-gp56 family major capsid protein
MASYDFNTTTGSAQKIEQLQRIKYNDIAQDRLFQNLVFYPLAQRFNVPSNSGNTFMVHRFGNIVGTTAALNEDTVTGGLTSLTANTATITMLQYGQFIKITEFAELTNRQSVIEDSVKVLSDAASDTVDLLCRTTLAANATSWIGANGNASTASIATTDTFSPNVLRRMAVKFASNKVRPFRDGMKFALVLHPFQRYDLLADTTVLGFASQAQLGQQSKVWNGEVGNLWQFRLLESQNIVTTTVTAGVTAYQAFALGENAFGCVSLEDSPIQIIVNKPGSGGSSDPYGQLATVAYKLRGFGVIALNMGETNARVFAATMAVSYNG